MRFIFRFLVLALAVGALGSAGHGQQPRGAPANASKAIANKAVVDAFVARMMAFDKNKDGKLTRDEITDRRLLRLFDRADKNKDGMVTREELIALGTELAAELGPEGRGPRGGFGPPSGRGPDGPRGFGGPRPGQVLPPPLQERLNLTGDQKKQIEALQKEVDARLAKILTADQKKQLREMRERGPRGQRPPERRPMD